MMMIRTGAAIVVLLASSTAFAQDGLLQRAGRALDNTGRNIRARVEGEVIRGQMSAQERDVLGRVFRRIEWDKQLLSSTLQLESRPGGVVVVRGAVPSEAAKRRMIDLVENTVGVTSVVAELAVLKEVRVIEAQPGTTIVQPAPVVIQPAPTVIRPAPPVVTPVPDVPK